MSGDFNLAGYKRRASRDRAGLRDLFEQSELHLTAADRVRFAEHLESIEPAAIIDEAGHRRRVEGRFKLRLKDRRALAFSMFGTRMAAAGVPMRTLQEWMGHADFTTTLIYADYSPDDRLERELIARAFTGSIVGSNLRETESNSEIPSRLKMRGQA